jgi:hypothetical protein
MIPCHISNLHTAAASLVRLHEELNSIHSTHLNCYEVCKKLILASYANMYTEALEYYLLGYANVTPLDLLFYLIDIWPHCTHTACRLLQHDDNTV